MLRRPMGIVVPVVVAILALLGSPSLTHAQVSGLVAAYGFNEASGTTVTDASGNNNNGTLGSGVTRTTAGRFGGALVFNGSGFVTVPNSPSLQLTTGMTLEAWVNPTTVSSEWRDLIYKGEDNYFLEVTSTTSGRPAAGGTFGSIGAITTGTASLATNTWTHLAMTYDQITLRLYVNGAQVASRSQTGQLATSTNALQIGGDSLFGQFFLGMVDEVRIYNRALSQAEIQTDMNAAVGAGGPDTTPPSVAITSPAGTPFGTNASPLTVAGTASDNVAVTQVSWANSAGGSGTATGTTAWSASGIVLQPGTNVITITARDAAGNPGNATLTVNYDPTAPTVAITSPTSGSTYVTNTSPLAVGGTASDNVGVSQVSWANSAGGSGPASGTTNWSVSTIALQPGTNTITITARDAVNNAGTATLTVTYTAPDTTPPTVKINTPTTGATYVTNASPLTLTGTATDNVGVTQVTWASDHGASGATTGTLPAWSAAGIPLQAGTNLLTITATDAAANKGTAQLTVTYDTIAPTVSLTAPAAGQVSGTVQVTAAASDNTAVAGVQFLLDNVALGSELLVGPYSLAWSTGTTTNGAHTLSARARDTAGNTTVATGVGVTVANTQPAGLVAAYSFNEGGGTVVNDLSGNNNNGTLGAGVTWTAQGKFGGALVFNGSSGKVTIPDAPSLRLTSGMTLEAWVNPSASTGSWGDVIYKGEDNYYIEGTSSNGNRPAAGGTFAGPIFGTTAAPLNAWTHIALTYDRVTLRLYVNGGQVSSTPSTAAIATSSNPLQIGGDSLFGQFFLGMIDEVRVYNRALSQAEIQTDMATSLGGGGGGPADTTPPTVALTAPAANSTVFNTIGVSATASDNVGVASVRFLVDGQQVGGLATNAPYTTLWDTTTVSPGTHTVTAVASDAAGNSTTSAPITVTVVAMNPSVGGQWAAPVAWPIVSVHTNLLATGEILSWDGQTAGHNARLWNPTTNVFTTVNNSNTNMFCAGHCHLADGQILVAGGHIAAHIGVTDTNIFNPTTRKWTLTGSMHTDRWYPTVTTLGDGRVLVTAGEMGCADCDAPISEVYSTQTGKWTELTSAPLALPYYPHMYVLPDGRVLASSSTEHPVVSQILDVNAQTWTVVDPNPVDGGSSAMYLPAKFVKAGISYHPDDPIVSSVATTYVLDLTQPGATWQQTAPMAYPRMYHTLSVLPDGNVLVTGGGITTDPVGLDGAVLPAELWSPTTQTWTTMASMTVPRLYHSEALLLPDARVLVLGGGRFSGVNEPTDQPSSEIYSPPYLFKGARPAISSAPSSIGYNTTITVQTPDAARIASAVLIRLGSVTHMINMDQRYLPLTFTVGAGSLSVQTPVNGNLAPPGYYMLFIVDTNGIPSVASILRIQ